MQQNTISCFLTNLHQTIQLANYPTKLIPNPLSLLSRHPSILQINKHPSLQYYQILYFHVTLNIVSFLVNNYTISQQLTMINTEHALYAEFIQCLAIRTAMRLTVGVEAQLEFQESEIKKEHGNGGKTKRNKLHLAEEYVESYQKLSKAEKVDLYKVRIKILTNIFAGIENRPMVIPVKIIDVFVRGATLRSWKHKVIQVNSEDLTLTLAENGKSRVHDLTHYILRKSKNTQYICFVLEAIDSIPKGKYDTIHIGFTNLNQFNIVYQQVKSTIEHGIFLHYKKELSDSQSRVTQSTQRKEEESTSQEKSSPPDFKFQEDQIRKLSQGQSHNTTTVPRQQTGIINRIILQQIDLKNFNESQHSHNSQKAAIIQQLIPDYDFDTLFSEQSMTVVEQSTNHKILQDHSNKKRFKVIITIPNSFKKVFFDLTTPEDLKKINPEIEEFSIKNMIKSQNTAVIYMKLRNYNAVYRGRDFLFLRHVFKIGKYLYIVDKSIENIDYPPFITIVRGEISAVWCLVQDDKASKTFMVLDATISNEGILNQQQNTNLTMRYISCFCRLEKYDYNNTQSQKIQHLFDINWNVSMEKQSGGMTSRIENMKQNLQENDVKKIQEVDEKKEKEKEKENKKQILMEDQIVEEEKGEKDLITKSDCTLWTPDLDREGRSIINWNCLSTKFNMQPWAQQQKIDEKYFQHHIWKGEWKRDQKDGGLWYKDEIRMNAQKKVLGYIVKKMGSNLIQGKSILSVSLPVDIFSTESNLERVARTFVYAPLILEKAATMTDPVEQLKQVVIVSLTHSLLYMSMEKPFNPVLGETFQGSINGCPIALEQISHHPPVAAFYFTGRGYRIYGCIESKMHIGVNTGTGLNEGDYVVHFDNGTIIKFRTPGGQISGLTFGDRKLNLVDKAFYWSPNKHLILDVSYNPNKKGMFSFGKQKTPMDYFCGSVKKVKKEFLEKFQSEKTKPLPSDKDILEEYCKVDGIWTKQVNVDGEVIFDIDKQKYLKFQYQSNPLPSDANYRQDIIYRRLDNIPRSQNEKEKIQVRQRQDRKLRDKFKKS